VSKKAFLIIISTIALAALSLYIIVANMPSSPPPILAQKITPICYPAGEEPDAPDFELVDQYNETVKLSDYWDKPVLITFTYTYCPSVCPIMHYVLNKTIPLINKYIYHVFDITLDPDRDTPNRLYAFAKGNKYNWTFLTGPLDELQRIWNAYGIYRSIKKEDVGYTVIHTVDYIVVKNGKILGRIRGVGSPETMAYYIIKFVKREC